MRHCVLIAMFILAEFCAFAQAMEGPEANEPNAPQGCAKTGVDAPTPDEDRFDALDARLGRSFDSGDYATAHDLNLQLSEMASRVYGPNDWRARHIDVRERTLATLAGLPEADRERFRQANIEFGMAKKERQKHGALRALPRFEEGLQIFSELLGADDFLTTQLQLQYAEALSEAVQPAKALELLKPVREERERQFGKDHPMYAEVVNQLAVATACLQQFAEATKHFRETERIYAATIGERSHQRVGALCNLIGVLTHQDEWDEVERLAQVALPIAAEHKSTDPTNYYRARILLSLALHKTGRLDDALSEFDKISDDLETWEGGTQLGFLAEFYRYYADALADAESEKGRLRIAELRKQQEKQKEQELPEECGELP